VHELTIQERIAYPSELFATRRRLWKLNHCTEGGTRQSHEKKKYRGELFAKRFLRTNYLSELPTEILCTEEMSSKRLAQVLEETPENATFERKGSWLYIYAN